MTVPQGNRRGNAGDSPVDKEPDFVNPFRKGVHIPGTWGAAAPAHLVTVSGREEADLAVGRSQSIQSRSSENGGPHMPGPLFPRLLQPLWF